MLRISVPSRVHMGLIDLGEKGYRRNGGVGFCIDNPIANFSYSIEKDVDLSFLGTVGFCSDDVRALEKRLLHMQEYFRIGGVKLIDADIPGRHIGLGVGTVTSLAAVESMSILYKLDLGVVDLIKQSGRGGTSGIGIHGYFRGGFIFDIGRKFDEDKIVSSDDIENPKDQPFALSQISMPEWQIGIFRNNNLNSVSASIERGLFSSVLPLAQDEVYKISYHSVFGALASVAVADFDAFCLAVNELQECAWKQAEIKLHGPSLAQDMKKLKELGCDAVGMSSVGPTLFFLAKNYSATYSRICEAFPNAIIFSSTPNNHGRVINYA
jgi:beta-ribofuranosylaminobenzene 5'-phosphate synthase